LATAQSIGRVRFKEDVSRLESPAEGSGNIWSRTPTWVLLLLLFYFALDGVSPFVNEPAATRAVATVSASGVLTDRLGKLVICVVCMIFALQRQNAVRGLSMHMKLVTSFPILALLLCPLSQQPSRTISSAVLLLGSTLLLYYIMSCYSPNQVLELLLILGTTTIAASIVFSLTLPQYGLDQTGGHPDAWKGVFSAKNYLGNLALFFLTVAMSYRPRTTFLRLVRVSQVIFCLTAIGFSRAATAYMLTAIYAVYFVILKTLHGFRKKDYLVVCLILVGTLFAAVVVIAVWPNSLFNLLGKDLTLTGRTQIWTSAIESIAKRPLLGYGYQAFWLGLEGESYRVILDVEWVLAQAQNASAALDGSRNLGRVGSDGRFEAFHRLAVAVEQKLGKVPLDVAANLRVHRLIRQEGVERRLIFTQYTDLGHHGKSHVVLVAAERFDLRIGARLLRSEVIGRNADDHQAAVLVLFIERFQAGVLRSVAAFAGDVHQKKNLAPVATQADRRAIDGLQGKAVNALRRYGHADPGGQQSENKG
jgi:exopolysaccharide production protein ExoQ